MTLVTIDLGDVAGGHHPDDHVVIRAEAFRESPGGGITSTAEVKIPLVNGVGQAEVEPGPVVVAFRCQAVADTREKRGVVPDSGTVGIEDVIAGAFEYTPPVANRALEDIQEALDGALGEVGSAVESQIEGIPHRGKALASGSDLNELRTPGPYYANISGVSTSILNRPTWANFNPFTVDVSRASLTNDIQYQVFTQGTSGAIRKSIRYLYGATVHPWQDIPIGIDFAGLLEEMVEVDLSRVVTIGDSQVGGAGKWPDKLNALSNEVTVVNQGAAGATPDEVLLRTSTRGVMIQPGVTLQPGVVVPVTLDWVPLTAPHRDFGIAGQINGQPSSLYYRREISGWTVSLAQGQPSLNVTEPMEWRVVPSENKSRRIAWFGGNSIRTGLSRPGETLAEHVMSAYSHVIKKWGPSTLVMGYVPAYGDMAGRDVADEIEKFLSRVAPENFLNIRRRLQDSASQVLGRSLTPGDLEDIRDGFLPRAMYESDNVHLQDITHAGVASIVSDFPAGSTHELAIGQTALSGYVTQSDLDLRVPVGAIESLIETQEEADTALGQRIDSVEWRGGLLGSIDLNTLTATKTYIQRWHQSADDVQALHYPTPQSGVLSVWEVAPGTSIQTYATQSGAWHRRLSGGVWTEWSIANAAEIDARVTAAEWQKIAVSNVNLNDFTTPGLYPMNLTGSTLNMPIVGPGSLEVFGIATHLSQRFTRWNMVRPETWQRSRDSAGVWSDWSVQTLRHPPVGSSDDLNSLVEDGYYPINSVNVANIPVSKIGILWVVALGSLVFQEFTDVDGSVFFRLKNPNGWGAWSPRGVNVEQIKNDIKNDISEEINKSDRSPIAESQLVRSDVNQATYPAAMTADRTIYFNGQSANGTASYSEDFGETWKDLKKFDGMFTFIEELGDGELIARVTGETVNEIWRSSGWPALREQCEWTKVLEAAAPGVYFSSAWGLSIYENIVLIAEYGAKYLPGSPASAEIGGNARYINLSLDYGKTFRRIFDLNEYATERGRDTANLHMHGVAWDPWWDRIWATCGDGGGAFIYSDDLGATWHTAHDGWAANAAGQKPHQSVGIVPMPDCVLFGTDSTPNGVLRIDRSEGKRLGEYPIEVAYVIDNDSGDLSHLAQRAYRVERAPGDYIAMFGFGTERLPGKSFAVATYDGYEFTKFWEDDQEVPLGRGLRTMIGPTLDGQVIIGSQDERTAHRWGLWEGDFRGY